MQSTAMAIGSSRSDDIIVKNAAPHEVILQVNCHGEVFSVRGHEVKELHHKECFYIGGRKFEWCYPARKDETSVLAESDESDASEVTPVLAVTDKTDIVEDSDELHELDESNEYPMLSVIDKTDIVEDSDELHELDESNESPMLSVIDKTDIVAETDELHELDESNESPMLSVTDKTDIVAETDELHELDESNESPMLSVTDETDIVADSDESHDLDESNEFPMLSVIERREVMHLLKKYKRMKNKYKELKKARAGTTVHMKPNEGCSTTGAVALHLKPRAKEAHQHQKSIFNQRMDMVETQGKMDKKVSTLFTSEMVDAIDMLNNNRSPCGIKEQNRYIFANQENGHLDSWQVLNKVAVRAGCKKPKLINSVTLRKYIATVSQILDLNDGEVQWLSSHLAHTVKTHKDFYRLKSAAVEIGKVSKLLLLTENGDVSKFKGKSLEEIQIDDSIAFDKGDIEEEKGLYDITEEDPLDEDLIQDEISERNFLNNGGSLECSRKTADPDELNLSDEHSETNFPSDAGDVKCLRNRQHLYGRSVKCIRKSPNHKLNSSETNFPSDAGGVKYQRRRQHLHGRSVKPIRNSQNPQELNLSYIDSDDSLRDPTYMDKNSSSNDDSSSNDEVTTTHFHQALQTTMVTR